MEELIRFRCRGFAEACNCACTRMTAEAVEACRAYKDALALYEAACEPGAETLAAEVFSIKINEGACLQRLERAA